MTAGSQRKLVGYAKGLQGFMQPLIADIKAVAVFRANVEVDFELAQGRSLPARQRQRTVLVNSGSGGSPYSLVASP